MVVIPTLHNIDIGSILQRIISTEMNEANYIVSSESRTVSEHFLEIFRNAQALVRGETDLMANCANVSSLVYHSLPDLNWCGFYLFKGEELVLGAFQGKPACTRVALGKGVCGRAAETWHTQVVDDVHQFAGHIACDPLSRSEIVVPMIWDDVLYGVMDTDSPIPARFGESETLLFEKLVHLILLESSPSFYLE